MAELQRALVLDANILIRAVLGSRVRDLIAQYAGSVAFFTPDVAYVDARTYLPDLLSKRSIDPEPALAVLAALEPIVHSIDPDTYAPVRDQGLARIQRRDEDDWPIIGTALVLQCPIWTEDQDSFGAGVPHLDHRPRGSLPRRHDVRPALRRALRPRPDSTVAEVIGTGRADRGSKFVRRSASSSNAATRSVAAGSADKLLTRGLRTQTETVSG